MCTRLELFMSLNIINSTNLAPREFSLFSVKHINLKWILSVYNNPFLIHATIDNEKTKFLIKLFVINIRRSCLTLGLFMSDYHLQSHLY